jgi:hypothetical protein
MSDASQANGLSDWDSIGNNRRGKFNALRLKSGSTYTVRLFHKPMKLFRYYVNGNSAITLDPDNCPVASHPGGAKPKLRYAINVIDRADGQVKVMEGPERVFKFFKKFWEDNGIDPGGNDGPDFVIKVTGEGLNTQYEMGLKMGSKPFTAEEKALLKAERKDLSALFAPTENILARLYPEEFGGDTGGNSTRQASAPAAPKAQTPAAPATGGDDDDDMAWAK